MNTNSLHSTDYYPFGMVMSERSYSSGGGYRYGFNGKEKLDEEHSTYDYGMRIYYNRLGRFLSVDPLFKTYPHYTPYQFSGNRPVAAVDVDGLEDMEVVSSYPINGDGTFTSTTITISMTYKVIRQGVGAVSSHNLPNPESFKKLWAMGNTTVYMKSLPSHGREGEILQGKHRRWARKAFAGSIKHENKLKEANVKAYKVDIVYDYSLDISPSNSLDKAHAWMEENIKGRGVIMEQAAVSDVSKDLFRKLYYFNQYANNKFKDKDVGGISTNDNPASPTKYFDEEYNQVSISENYIILPKETNMRTSVTSRTVHESGHNAAQPFLHGTGYYEYHHEGLPSNGEDPSPTQNQSIDIINDKTNRKGVFPTRIAK